MRWGSEGRLAVREGLAHGTMGFGGTVAEDLDPHGAFRFALEIDGIEVAHFAACEGLSTRARAFEVEEGGVNDRVHRFVGPSTPGHLTLKTPLTATGGLLAWREACRQGDHDGDSSGAITLLAPDGRRVVRWEITRAWPVAWQGPELDSATSDLAVEAVEVAHEGLTTR